MSQKYDEYLEKHRQAVKKAYQWIAAYIPELTDVEATRNIEFHDMSKNTPDEYTPYDNYFYGEQTPVKHRLHKTRQLSLSESFSFSSFESFSWYSA